MNNRLLRSFVIGDAVGAALAQLSQVRASPVNPVQSGDFATGDLTRWSNPGATNPVIEGDQAVDVSGIPNIDVFAVQTGVAPSPQAGS